MCSLNKIYPMSFSMSKSVFDQHVTKLVKTEWAKSMYMLEVIPQNLNEVWIMKLWLPVIKIHEDFDCQTSFYEHTSASVRIAGTTNNYVRNKIIYWGLGVGWIHSCSL